MLVSRRGEGRRGEEKGWGVGGGEDETRRSERREEKEKRGDKETNEARGRKDDFCGGKGVRGEYPLGRGSSCVRGAS